MFQKSLYLGLSFGGVVIGAINVIKKLCGKGGKNSTARRP